MAKSDIELFFLRKKSLMLVLHTVGSTLTCKLQGSGYNTKLHQYQWMSSTARVIETA